jgi:hypothetical protein
MQTVIEIVVGLFLGVGFVLIVRMSRSYARSFAIGLVVTALIYVGLAIFKGSGRWILIELAGVAIFAVFAWLGLRKSGWMLALGWALHPLWDAGLHDYSTQFVPHWYIGGCIGFDLLVAIYIAFRVKNLNAKPS